MPNFTITFSENDQRNLGLGKKSKIKGKVSEDEMSENRKAARTSGLRTIEHHAKEAKIHKYKVSEILKDLHETLSLAHEAINSLRKKGELRWRAKSTGVKGKTMVDFLFNANAPVEEYICLYVALYDFLYSNNNFFSGFQPGACVDKLEPASCEILRKLIAKLLKVYTTAEKGSKEKKFAELIVIQYQFVFECKPNGKFDFSENKCAARKELGCMNNVYLLYNLIMWIAGARIMNYFARIQETLFIDPTVFNRDVTNILNISLLGISSMNLVTQYMKTYLEHANEDFRYAVVSPQIIHEGKISSVNDGFSVLHCSMSDQSILFLRYWYQGKTMDQMEKYYKLKNYEFTSKDNQRRGSFRYILKKQNMNDAWENSGFQGVPSEDVLAPVASFPEMDEAQLLCLKMMADLDRQDQLAKKPRNSSKRSNSSTSGDGMYEEEKKEESVPDNDESFADNGMESLAIYTKYAESISRKSSAEFAPKRIHGGKSSRCAMGVDLILSRYIDGRSWVGNSFRKHLDRARAVKTAVRNYRQQPAVISNILKNQLEIMDGRTSPIDAKVLAPRWSQLLKLKNKKHGSYYNAITQAILLCRNADDVVASLYANKIKYFKTHPDILKQVKLNKNLEIQKTTQTSQRKSSTTSSKNTSRNSNKQNDQSGSNWGPHLFARVEKDIVSEINGMKIKAAYPDYAARRGSRVSLLCPSCFEENVVPMGDELCPNCHKPLKYLPRDFKD